MRAQTTAAVFFDWPKGHSPSDISMTTPPATRNSFKIESDKFDSSRNLFLGLSQAGFNPTRQTYAASRVLLFLQGDRRGRCSSFNNETKPFDGWLDVAEVHQQASKQPTLSKAVDNERWKRKSYCQRRRDPLRCLANEAIAEASLTVLAIAHWWTSGQANNKDRQQKDTARASIEKRKERYQISF